MSVLDYENSDGLKFTRIGKVGEFLVVDSTKLTETLEYIKIRGGINLYLNWQLGFSLNDLSFLQGVEYLIEGLMLVVDNFNLTGLEKFKNVKYLHFSDENNQAVNFENFTKLNYCSIKWNLNYKKANFPSSITKLNIRSYNEKFGFNENSLNNLRNVTEITLIHPAINDLILLKYCGSLIKVHIAYGRNLKDISELASHAASLTHVEIDKCKKIADFSVFSQLTGLQWLNLCDCNKISDISFVRHMPLLSHFVFYGTLIEDGDLSYLRRVSHVAFDNKAHYSLKQEHFT
jgi:hypothetical protein